MTELAPVQTHNKPHPYTVLQKVDWALLKQQRLALRAVVETGHLCPDTHEQDVILLDGLVNFLEALTDAYEDRYGDLPTPTAEEN